MRNTNSYSYSYYLAALALAAVACDQPPAGGEAAAALHAPPAAADDEPSDCGRCPHGEAEAHAAGASAGAPKVALAPREELAKAEPARVEVDVSRAPLKGEVGAPVTVVVYSDFECPFCKRGAARVAELSAKYGRDVRIAFKHFPLPFHARAPRAAAAAVAAQNQGKFWEMHDRLFAQGAALDDAALLEHARALGLDEARFARDLEDPATQARVDADIAEGKKLGVQGTPTFFVSGERVVGAQPLESFTAAVDRALARR